MFEKTKVAMLLCGLLFSRQASADLLTNGSFEAPNGYFVGQQGVMPPYWVATNDTPDLYSNDGSFGLEAGAYGNFLGVTAQDGLGWVAGWSLVVESFAQDLGTTLTPGVQYSISAFLRQANTYDVPGAYRILLNSSNSLSGALEVATWSPTTGADYWEYRNANFVAPQNSDQLPWLIFRPYTTVALPSYPGLDSVVLTAVPEPSSCILFSAFVGAYVASRGLCNRRTMQ